MSSTSSGTDVNGQDTDELDTRTTERQQRKPLTNKPFYIMYLCFAANIIDCVACTAVHTPSPRCGVELLHTRHVRTTVGSGLRDGPST